MALGNKITFDEKQPGSWMAKLKPDFYKVF
jgi:hypothetical protein